MTLYYTLLSDTDDDIYKYLLFLLERDWESVPNMNMIWLVKNGMRTYILTNEENTPIGIVVMELRRQTIHAIELLPEYRGKGYAKDFVNKLISRERLHYVMSPHPFWEKFDLYVLQ